MVLWSLLKFLGHTLVSCFNHDVVALEIIMDDVMLVQHGHSLYKNVQPESLIFSRHCKAARHHGGGSDLQDLLENGQQYRKMIAQSP